MNFDPKYKKITVLIILIVGVSLVITAIILTKLIKDADATEEQYFFFRESIESGQPVTLEDVYIISTAEDRITFLYDDMTYEVNGVLEEEYSGVANITVNQEKIERISIKPDSKEGVLSSYTDSSINIKDIGEFPRKSTVPVYQILDQTVEQKDWNAFVVGVSNAHFVLEEGVVCAILIEENITPTDIRVLIKNENEIFHSKLYVKKLSENKVVNIHRYFEKNKAHKLILEDETGLVLCDENGVEKSEIYEGRFYIHETKDGYVLVNELPIETYLKYVVPSEMQTSFGQEALKAQAICARTFAFSQMNNQSYAEYGANLDDSTAFQAYHKSGRYEETDLAVEETKGEVITCNGELIVCYYYSTSPGVTNTMNTWQSEDLDYIACSGLEFSNGLNLQIESDFSKFINQQADCYDSDSSFYRWKAILDINKICEEEHGKLKSISVKSRNEAGYITALELEYEKTTEILRNENEIRTVLGKYLYEIILNNEKIRTDLKMVPSACFEIAETKENQIILHGGGFGHGIGMSQYGAKAMASAGASYKEILEYYYENIAIKNIQE